jgi:hypothetical protein
VAATPVIPERSYGCTFGCGNPYDYVFISVRDGTTEFLCLPCFVRLAHDMLSAVTEPDPEQAASWLRTISPLDAAPMRESGPHKRGHNAPATNDDPDLFDAFDAVITQDELGDEFK